MSCDEDVQRDLDHKENGTSEECINRKVVDNMSRKKDKKKKKKKTIVEVNVTIDEESGYSTSMVEDESLKALPRKKKKNKTSSKRSVEESVTDLSCEGNENNERLSVMNVGDEKVDLFGKKKKRKMCETEKSTDDVVRDGLLQDGKEDEISSLLEVRSELFQKRKKKRSKPNKKVDSQMQTNDSKGKELQTTGDAIEMEVENKSLELEVTMEEEAENFEDSELPESEKADETGGFTIIDDVQQIRKKKVYRVLPHWLSNPTVVSTDLRTGVPLHDLEGVDRYLLNKLRSEKIHKFFPVQTVVIPELLVSSKSVSVRYRPRDVCVSAPTGSGKTLAYVLPIIQALMNRVVPQLRALVILPTQDLASQVYSVFVKYTQYSKLKVCLVIGKQDFKKEQANLVFQDAIGNCAADILIATPGRLADHISYTSGLNFKHLRFLVMDEADLFLSSSGGDFMLKIEQLKKSIHRTVPNNRVVCGDFQPVGSKILPEPYLQQILISATLMHDPEQLKVLDLYRPKLFIANSEMKTNYTLQTVGAYMRPQEIREEYLIVDSTLKPLVLHHLLSTSKLHKVLVFTKSKIATHTLTIVLSALSKNCKIAQFSSNERRRKKILSDFCSGKVNVLVCSDAMARGIDISDIEQVVSYDVPSVQTYVHRTGRTGRAGKKGFALTLVEDTPEVKRDFKSILMSCKDRLTKIHISQKELERYSVQYEKALETLKETVLKEKKRAKLKKNSNRIRKFNRRKFNLKHKKP